MSVLEGANVRSVAGSGCESFVGVHCTGFVDGDCPWDLSWDRALVSDPEATTVPPTPKETRYS